MNQKITLDDLAKRAGVHRSTVSLALRDSPRISLPVRRRIQALAEEMKYRINPLVAALMQSRRSARPVKNVVLAYVTNHPTRYGWRPPNHNRPNYFPGAAAQARGLGYRLEDFWLAEPGMTSERFAEILSTRRINGILIGRLAPGQHTVTLPWEQFSCVALGLSLRSPALHRVTEDFFLSMWRVMEELMGRGYRRIGFAFLESKEIPSAPAVHEYWIGAFWQQQDKLEERDRIPTLFFDNAETQEQRFVEWFERWQPEVLIVPQPNIASTWLKRLGKRVPQDVGIASLALDREHLAQGWAGIYSNAPEIGAIAVDMLVDMMHRGEAGIPAQPRSIILAGKWYEGVSLKPRK